MIDSLEQRIETLESELQKRITELEGVNREIAGFGYAVSHDLRSPLRAIDGFSELLAEDYRDVLDETARDYLDRIRSSAARMEEMLTALQSLAQVSRAPLRRERVSLTDIASPVAAQLRDSDPDRKVEFSIAPDLYVEGDSTLLRIAFEHLLRNAWKFTSRNPSASIEVGETWNDGSRAIFVRDDGAGFDPAYADKLFTPFQRLHSASEFEGNGIGLALVRRIVHRHGGKVRIAGDVNRGATVYLELE